MMSISIFGQFRVGIQTKKRPLKNKESAQKTMREKKWKMEDQGSGFRGLGSGCLTGNVRV